MSSSFMQITRTLTAIVQHYALPSRVHSPLCHLTRVTSYWLYTCSLFLRAWQTDCYCKAIVLLQKAQMRTDINKCQIQQTQRSSRHNDPADTKIQHTQRSSRHTDPLRYTVLDNPGVPLPAATTDFSVLRSVQTQTHTHPLHWSQG
jgi:hypothetical protein